LTVDADGWHKYRGPMLLFFNANKLALLTKTKLNYAKSDHNIGLSEKRHFFAKYYRTTVIITSTLGSYSGLCSNLPSR
jgi:hypothetical protein